MLHKTIVVTIALVEIKVNVSSEVGNVIIFLDGKKESICARVAPKHCCDNCFGGNKSERI